MNAVEKLQAAIDKLEELKQASVPGPWSVYALDWRLIVTGDPHDDDADIVFDVARRGFPADGELVVTLHRTIDAQLAILRTSLVGYSKYPPAREPGWEPKSTHMRNALELATAILGGS